MEKTSNKPSVIVISFIKFGSDEYEVRVCIPYSGKLAGRIKKLENKISDFSELASEVSFGDSQIKIMTKEYDTLYAATASCETLNEFVPECDNYTELLICTTPIIGDELTALEEKVDNVLNELNQDLELDSFSNDSLRSVRINDAGSDLEKLFGDYWDSKE